MRAAFLERLPGMSQFYGIHPWDLPKLTPDEREFYLDRLPEGW